MFFQVLKLEKSILQTFQEYDQTERELFTAFTDSIRDSHEKQRAQMEYTKYFGFILSITGSFLAFIYTTLKKEQLKQIIDDRLQTLKFSQPEVTFTQLIESTNQVQREVVSTKRELEELGNKLLEKLIIVDSSKSANLVSEKAGQFLHENFMPIIGVTLFVLIMSKIF